MQKKIIILAIASMLMISVANAQEVNVSIGYDAFYDQLSPYGVWVDYPGVGYVWKYDRSTSPRFKPYSSRGHWVYTDYGWTWVSDYPWGWATFHYGRWFYDDYMGWLWVPGDEWAPAWVTWGEYDNNFAWAPIGPGIDFNVNFSTYHPPARYWVACPGTYFGRNDWNTHVVNITHNTTVVNNITIINNRGTGNRPYARGPEAQQVQRFSGREVRPVQVAAASRPAAATVANNRVAIYRPSVNANANTAKPQRVQEITRFRPAPAAAQNPARPREAQRPAPVVNQPQPQRQTPVVRPAQPQPEPRNRPNQPQVRPEQPAVRPANPQSAPATDQPRESRPEVRSTPRVQPNQPAPVRPYTPPLPQPNRQAQPQPHPQVIPGARPYHPPARPNVTRPVQRPPQARPPQRQAPPPKKDHDR